jgi:VCBS repeat-containing protein
MAFTGSFMSTSFKGELLSGTHLIKTSSGDVFKMALYTSSATMDASTTVYSATNEVSGTNYSAGGVTLTNIDPQTSGTTGYTQFSNATFTNVTLTARGALIYNSSKSNKAVCVLDFGSDKTATAGDFVVTMPTNNSSSALLRIA